MADDDCAVTDLRKRSRFVPNNRGEQRTGIIFGRVAVFDGPGDQSFGRTSHPAEHLVSVYFDKPTAVFKVDLD